MTELNQQFHGAPITQKPTFRLRVKIFMQFFSVCFLLGLVFFRWPGPFGFRSLADIAGFSFTLALLIATFDPLVLEKARARARQRTQAGVRR